MSVLNVVGSAPPLQIRQICDKLLNCNSRGSGLCDVKYTISTPELMKTGGVPAIYKIKKITSHALIIAVSVIMPRCMMYPFDF